MSKGQKLVIQDHGKSHAATIVHKRLSNYGDLYDIQFDNGVIWEGVDLTKYDHALVA